MPHAAAILNDAGADPRFYGWGNLNPLNPPLGSASEMGKTNALYSSSLIFEGTMFLNCLITCNCLFTLPESMYLYQNPWTKIHVSMLARQQKLKMSQCGRRRSVDKFGSYSRNIARLVFVIVYEVISFLRLPDRRIAMFMSERVKAELSLYF